MSTPISTPLPVFILYCDRFPITPTVVCNFCDHSSAITHICAPPMMEVYSDYGCSLLELMSRGFLASSFLVSPPSLLLSHTIFSTFSQRLQITLCVCGALQLLRANAVFGSSNSLCDIYIWIEGEEVDGSVADLFFISSTTPVLAPALCLIILLH